nr:uncharacterized mitochondrial protein AtMg00810-like [Tanacetum cinerariifolium]
FEDPDYPDKVYKVVKALYGLHQAPRAWSMIGYFMYLTSSRPDIMFVVCACARFQVTPKVSHLHAVKRIFRYLKGKLHLGLWYPNDSPFNLVAYSDSDYARASLDRKSITGAAASCCAQVLWIENQLLDYSNDALAIPGQTATGKESSNPFMADSLPITILLTKPKFMLLVLIEAQHHISNESPLLGVNIPRCDEDSLEQISKLMLFGLTIDAAHLMLLGHKSDAGEGFDQIVNFLNAHMIQYALMVNPTIYVSCIKQFWTSVSIKKSNDVVRLKALIDRKKVIITEDTIRQALRLDDAAGVDCLPNEEIFAELASMGYEKPIGKGFSGVDTPLFDGMLVPQQVHDVEDTAEDEDDDHEVSVEPTLPSPTQEHIPSPPQAQTAQPSSPPPQQPLQTTDISMTLLNTFLETCSTLTKQGRLAESQAKVYHLDLQHSEKVLSMQDTDEAEPAKVEELIKVVTASKLMTKVVTTAATTTITTAQVPKASALRRRRGVIIQDPEDTAIALVIDEAFTRQLEAKLNANVNWNDVLEEVKRKEQQDNTVMRCQALKRKHVTEAQARKNMMIYLKNMDGFKMDFIKGMTYNDIRPIFEKHYNSIKAFLEKGGEEIKEEGNKRKGDSLNQDAANKQRIDEETKELKVHLQIVVNNDDVFTEATPLASKVPVVDYQIYHENNKPYYKIIRADGTHKLFLSFITLLKNFDREDLEILWKLVQERFQSSEPKNFSDDFLLNTLKIMFEKPNMILVVEKKYPLTHFTLEQILNNVRLEIEEESEMSLELLRLMRRQLQEGYIPPPDQAG